MSFPIGITDHLEGPIDRPSAEIYAEVADLVVRADALGAKYFWFAEHHIHLHHGHLPTPLLFALQLINQTHRIQLGAAVICLNLHNAVDIAEQVATADILSGGRIGTGFGSGSTDEESALFEIPQRDEAQRHAQFERSLFEIRRAWSGAGLPRPRADLWERCWSAVNSISAAQIAGRMNLNILFSHLRTPREYAEYSAAYRQSGGRGSIAANRPVFVGRNDEEAHTIAAPAIRKLWRRFQAEGKIAAEVQEPKDLMDVCRHPLNFIVGGPQRVAEQLNTLRAESPFDVLNAEVRWDGLSHENVRDSIDLLLSEVGPRMQDRP